MSDGRKTDIERKKRVNQLKMIIVFVSILLVLASVILNFILMFKVIQLQNKIDKLYSMERSMVTMEL